MFGGEVKRPALDYFGGKWKCADKIISRFPEHKSFVDVFCGAASITLRKPRSKNEIINDLNAEVTNFFKVLRDDNLKLRVLLEKTPYSREEYYRCRELSDDIMEQARRTVVKSWFGIGDSLDNETGFRVSLSQGGSTTKPWLTYIDYLHLYAERLRGVIIETLDFEEAIKRYDRTDTLFYLDPPYEKETRSKKHAYKHEWDPADHERLLRVVSTIRGAFVLSGYLAESYKDLPYRRESFEVMTQATSQTGATGMEYIWIKTAS
jgi:DNA adenine methylase